MPVVQADDDLPDGRRLLRCEIQADRAGHDLAYRPLGHGIGILPALRLAVPLGQLVTLFVDRVDEEGVVEVNRLQSLPGDGDGQGSGRWQSGRWQSGRLQGVGRAGRGRLIIEKSRVSGQECDLVATENNGWRCGWIDLGEARALPGAHRPSARKDQAIRGRPLPLSST